jgi:AcrR family transcriptional regulator
MKFYFIESSCMSGDQYLPLYNDIMNAGELVLRQQGMDRGSLDDVARILRYSPIQLRFFFGGREPLWEAIIARRLEKIVTCLPLNPNGEDNRTAEGRLCAALDNLVRESRVFQRDDPMLFAAYRSLSQTQAQAITQFQRKLTTCVEGIIARGIQSHEFSGCDPWQASWATLNAIAPFYDPRFGRDWSAPREYSAYCHARASVLKALVLVADA